MGLPKSIRLDNAKCFKSRRFGKFLEGRGIRTEFVTPYLHTANGVVEITARTLQDFVKVYLKEGNSLKNAVRRTVKMLRFSVHSAINMTLFEKLTGNKPRSMLTNVLNLENPEKTLVTLVTDLDGNVMATEKHMPKELEQLESSKSWRSNSQDSRRVVNESTKRPMKKVRKFVVEKNRSKKGWDSKFQQLPRQVNSETEHRVTVGNRTIHKKDVAEVVPNLAKKCFQAQRKQEDPLSEGNADLEVLDRRSTFKRNLRERRRKAKQRIEEEKEWKSTHKTPADLSGESDNYFQNTVLSSCLSGTTETQGETSEENTPEPSSGPETIENSSTEDSALRRSKRIPGAAHTRKFGGIPYS